MYIDELISEIKKRYNDGNGGEYTKQNLLEDEYRVFCMGDYDDPEDVQFRIARATVPESLRTISRILYWQSVCVRSLRCAASAELLQSSLMLMTTDSKDTICLEIVFRSVM